MGEGCSSVCILQTAAGVRGAWFGSADGLFLEKRWTRWTPSMSGRTLLALLCAVAVAAAAASADEGPELRLVALLHRHGARLLARVAGGPLACSPSRRTPHTAPPDGFNWIWCVASAVVRARDARRGAGPRACRR